ncbi:NlpC/P60 family protein [Mycobacterium heckeshornense]|uniref:NlpC/P60 family protein n=1 Tax=Mycobacterium heckeshornense TaxID=110505 RepID=UPI00069DC049|nr:NlpC/P60 family protein [Mycobacterium heckeshornense]
MIRTGATVLAAHLLLLSAMSPQSKADAATVVAVARTAIGRPYQWGAAGPDAFDCSGLVVWAFAQIGVQLPHSSEALAVGGQPITRDELAPGDIVTFYPNATHAAIYSGDGMVIHASKPGQPVAEVPLDQAGPFHNARHYS